MSILLKRSVVAVVVSLVAPFLAVGVQAGDPVPGRFGNGVDVSHQALRSVNNLEAYKAMPFTVELWCKVNNADDFNVLVANEPKESATHWKLFARRGGVLCADFRWYQPGLIASVGSIADGQWHYVAMTVASNEVALFVDGRKVGGRAVSVLVEGKTVAGPLCIGITESTSSGFLCNGEVDEIRISSGIREISGIPSGPIRVRSLII